MDPPVPNESWPSQQAEDESWTVPVDPSLDATSGSADFLAHIPQHSFTIAVRPHVRYKRNYPRLTGWDTFTNPETPSDSLITTFVQHHAEQYVASHSFEMLDGDDHWDNIWTFLRAYHQVTCSPSTAAAAQSRMLSARATLLSRFVDLLRTDAHQLSATLQEAYMTSTGQLRCFVVSFVDEAPAIAVQGETPSYVWVDR